MKHLLFPVLLFTTSCAAAQNTIHGDTIITKKAFITYRADRLTPVTYLDISSKEFKQKSTGQEPSFLLSETPSITAYSDAGNTQGYSYYRIRGIDQTRINTTLDGMPLNEPEDQGAYFSNYPDLLNSVSRMQIQRGVGTSKNGSAGYGGNIQLFSPNLYEPAGTEVGLGYGSFNSLRAYAEYKSGVKNKKAFYARASEVYSDGYKYTSGNNSQSVFLSAASFADKSTWKINVLAGHQQNQLAWLAVSDSLIQTDRRTNANKGEQDNFTQYLAQLVNIRPLGNRASLQSSIYYTFLDGNYDFNPSSFSGLPSTGELFNYAFLSHFAGGYSNYSFQAKHLIITTGIEGHLYSRSHTGSYTSVGELYSNTGHKDEGGAFVKAGYNWQHFNLFADVQYRYTSFSYEGSVHLDRIKWNFINPKAGISYELPGRAVLYYTIGNTGREPTRNDIFGGSDDLLSDSVRNPITFVTTPEYVTDQEIGYRVQHRNFSINANGYYMAFRNEIVLDGKIGPNGLALTNKVERSYRSGLELTATYNAGKHFSFINNSSFNYSRIEEQKEIFSPILTPPLIINQEVRYNYKHIDIALSARYQDKAFIDFANTAAVNAYTLINARVGYQARHIGVTLFLYNITNTKYYNSGYVDYDGSKKYYVQAPANFYLSLKYRF